MHGNHNQFWRARLYNYGCGVQALRCVSYVVQEQEKKSLQFRRSLYIVEDMKKGDVLTEKNMRSILRCLGFRPGFMTWCWGRGTTATLSGEKNDLENN